jgi:hypothetical protein
MTHNVMYRVMYADALKAVEQAVGTIFFDAAWDVAEAIAKDMLADPSTCITG